MNTFFKSGWLIRGFSFILLVVVNCDHLSGRNKTFRHSGDRIVNGRPQKPDESPWNAAIYSELDRPTPQFICEGTIISEDLIVSAAHCFYDDVNERLQEAKHYQIAVAKKTMEYASRSENETPTFYNVTKILFSPHIPYKGAVTWHAGDIALLQTSEKITFNQAVSPACVYWNMTFDFHPNSSVQGELVGFGRNKDGSLGVYLQLIHMPYISFTDCFSAVHEDFVGEISLDKFCAGISGDPAALKVDGGAGLLFPDPSSGQYCLYGIASLKDSTYGRNSSSIIAFTNLNYYVDWIKRVRNGVEDD